MSTTTEVNPIELLRFKVYKGFKERGYPLTQEYVDRIEYELKVIEECKFANYFLIVGDICRFMREKEIIHMPRGSGAGSAVVWGLGITHRWVDPVKYGIPFERFLNPHRVSNPDIDIDIQDDRRHEVVQYTIDKYGADKVARIITFSVLGAKSAMIDILRALNVPDYQRVAAEISALIPGGKGEDGKNWRLKDVLKQSEALRDFEKQYPEAFKLAMRCEGKVRHPSIHAAGTIIAPDDMVKFCPLFFKGSPDNRSESDWFPTTQWDMYDCEDRGLLKMDYLGLKTLRVIDQTQKAVNHILKALGKEPNFHIDYVDREDEKTWRLLAEGRLAGVFQVERGFVREFARRMNLAATKDPWQLAILVAIIRPGMMDSGNTEAYLRRASGMESPDAPHPLLADTFKRSLGLMCFQEDVMSTCEDFSGMTKAEADVIRKGVGKKNKDFITKQQPKFFEGARQPRVKVTVDKKVFVTKPRNPAMQEALAGVGFEIDFKNPAQPVLLHKKAQKLTNVSLEVIAPGATHEECEHIWHLIEAHSRYSFNNAHAGVYGMVGTYQTAYLKANWPLPFMTFLINSESGATSKEDGYNYKVAEYVEEARALGLKVLPPCVRRSGPLCSMIWPQQAIRFGLSMIKKVAEGSVEWIIRNCRKAESIRDFIISCYSVEKNDKGDWKAYNKVNKTNLEALCAAGAFDCYDKDRDKVAYLLPILSKWAEKYWDQHCKARNGKKVRVTPEQILDEMNKALFADEVPEGSLEKQLEAEREVTGCFLSQSPFEPFRETIRQYCNCTPSEITEGSVDGAMVFVGMVSQSRAIIIKNGKNKGQEMGIVKFQGIGGDLEAAAFMQTWARQKEKSGGFERGKVYIVHVKPDRNGRGYIIEDATRLSGCGYGE